MVVSKANSIWNHLLTFLTLLVVVYVLVGVAFEFFFGGESERSPELSGNGSIISIAFVLAILLSPYFLPFSSIWKDLKRILQPFFNFKIPFWKFPAFRWLFFQTLFLTFGIMMKFGAFDYYSYEIAGLNLEGIAVLIWIIIFVLPAAWVWRKPILKRIRKLISSLNKAAEED